MHRGIYLSASAILAFALLLPVAVYSAPPSRIARRAAPPAIRITPPKSVKPPRVAPRPQRGPRFQPSPVLIKASRAGKPFRYFNRSRLVNLPGDASEASVAATLDLEIEPAFTTGAPGLMYAKGGSKPAIVVKPDTSNYPDTKTKDKTLKEPLLFDGVDYVLMTPRGRVQMSRGEFFEPSSGRAQDPKNITETRRLAFSAFLPGDNDVYKGSGDEAGLAVRVIGYSDDALNPGTAQPSITKVLAPYEYGSGASTDADGNPTAYSLFAPDASPTVFPGNSRFIVFVSLRGYQPGDGKNILPDPTTYYTSLWLWDTSNDTPVLLLSLPNQSILQPRFSPDGKYLAYTVTDVAFPPAAWKATNSITVAAAAPDPVVPFDVVPANDPASALTKPMQSAVFVAPVGIGDPLALGASTQVSAFEVGDQAARDMMPFWSELNQIGFSSDRADSDDDGYADSLPATPAAGIFSLYTFPRPFEPPVQTDPLNPKPYEDVSTPDLTPSRQLLGVGSTNTFNALKGDWAPLAPTSSVGAATFIGNTDARNILGNNVLALQAPRVICQTNKGGNADLWGTSKAVQTVFNGHLLTDLPTITPKQGTPGEPVTISVDVNPDYLERDTAADPPTLLSRVFAVIKDPDNRLYHLSNGLVAPQGVTQANAGVNTLIYREVNSDLAYFDSATVAAYVARYAGDPNAPQIGGLIELTESPAGSNHFTALWSTPLEASDFIVDIIADTAGVPMISDNIQGFTTAPWVPYSPFLVVSDFAQGQEAIPYTTLTPSTAGVPTESYFTQRPHSDWSYSPGDPSSGAPTTAEVWADLGPRVEFQSATLAQDPGTGRMVPDLKTAALTGQPLTDKALAGPYDLWRTQCRPPIDATVLQEYVPYVELQPGFPDTTTTRQQRVADRSVLWFAPHAGQVDGSAGRHADQFGTLGNVATQAVLVDFLKKGGRMLLAGDDVAFTLAQDMPSSRNPLMERFRVRYESGRAADVDTFTYAYQRTTMKATSPDNKLGLNPIPYTAWEPNNFHFQGALPSQLALAPFYSYPKGTYLPNLTLPINPSNMREDGALTNLFIDSIIAVPPDPTKPLSDGYGGEAIFTYDDKKIAAVQSQAGFKTLGTGPSAYLENTSAYKTVFFAFGLEGIDREYAAGGGGVSAWNPKALIMHNVADFLSTGTITGRVFLNNSATPVNNVIVRAVDGYRGDAKGLLRCIAVSGPSTVSPNNRAGEYAVRGLDASVYRVDAYKAGYVFVNAAGATVHGGQQSNQVNLYLIPVPAGTLTGTVTDRATKAPVADVLVHIHDVGGALDLTAVTAADGTYRFDSVLAGLFDVSSTKEGYLPFVSSPPKTVAAGPAITKLDFAIDAYVPPPPPAIINGTVVDETDAPIAGATVTVMDATGTAVTTTDAGPNPATTDAAGAFTFSVPAADYTVKAEVTGRVAQTTDVSAASGSITTIKFTVGSTPPPTVLKGAILDPEGLPITDAKVTLLDQAGAEVPTLDSGANPFTTLADGIYSFDIPPAAYTLKAEAAGFDTSTKDVTVPANKTTTFDITLQRTIIPGILQGIVTDKSTLQPVPDATVRVRGVDNSVDQSATTDSSGLYSVAELPPGSYTVDASATGYDAYATAAPITVTQGPEATILDISLQPTIVPPKPSTLIISVLDALGSPSRPLSGARVTAADPATRLPLPTLDGGANPASTGTSGTLTFHVAAGTYAVTVEAAGYRDQTRTVTLQPGGSPTTLTFTFGGIVHRFPAGRVLLSSAPFDFSGTDFTSVLGLSAGMLQASAVTFDGLNQAFLFYPAFPSDTFHLGKGYGLKLPAEAAVHDVGSLATTGTDGNYAIQLNTGWNLIGDPFDATIPWDDSANAARVKAVFTGGSSTTYSISEATSMGLLVSPLWGGYNDVNGSYLAGYASMTSMVPWEARWVKAAQPLMLLVPKPTVSTVKRPMGKRQTASHSPLRAPANVWGMNITVTSGALIDDDLALGIDGKGTAGYDRGLDLAKPDPMAGGLPYLHTSFPQTWSGRSGGYATDVRGDLNRSDWTLRVAANSPNADVNIIWTAWGALPAGCSATLVDAATGKRVDMAAAKGYTFRTGRDARPATFRVELRGKGSTGGGRGN